MGDSIFWLLVPQRYEPIGFLQVSVDAEDASDFTAFVKETKKIGRLSPG